MWLWSSLLKRWGLFSPFLERSMALWFVVAKKRGQRPHRTNFKSGPHFCSFLEPWDHRVNKPQLACSMMRHTWPWGPHRPSRQPTCRADSWPQTHSKDQKNCPAEHGVQTHRITRQRNGYCSQGGLSLEKATVKTFQFSTFLTGVRIPAPSVTSRDCGTVTKLSMPPFPPS